jgi:hypothetical protein
MISWRIWDFVLIMIIVMFSNLKTLLLLIVCFNDLSALSSSSRFWIEFSIISSRMFVSAIRLIALYAFSHSSLIFARNSSLTALSSFHSNDLADLQTYEHSRKRWIWSHMHFDSRNFLFLLSLFLLLSRSFSFYWLDSFWVWSWSVARLTCLDEMIENSIW